jgi:antitoxin (DNA-binding transcriptional repressor) of toxin-antitoxin stability system
MIHRSSKRKRPAEPVGLIDALVFCYYLGCYIGEVMAKFATLRDLKNQTTALIREAEKGKAVVVTRRGKPVATLKRFDQKDLEKDERYPTSAYDNLKRQILSKYPRLAKETPEQARRRFDKISEKIRRSLPFKTWKEMDRFVKGDRYGLTR